MKRADGYGVGEGAGHTTLPPTPEEVRAQLARIVRSPEFAVPERACSFLCYIVEETLAGRADRLKGFTIATAVFDRDETFNSQADPVVRIEAGRLRRALERYYLVAGQEDTILIEVPKGRYIPTFTRRAAPDPPTIDGHVAPTKVVAKRLPSFRQHMPMVALAGVAALTLLFGGLQLRPAHRIVSPNEASLPDRPSLLVSRFISLSEGDESQLYAAGMTEEVLTRLSRFKDLMVLGRETTRSIPAAADTGLIARELAARYILTGSLSVSGSEVRVISHVEDTSTGVVLWAQSYREDLRAKGLFVIQEDIARRVATAVAQPYGVIFQSDLQRTADQPPDDLDAYACTLRFYVYRAEPSPEGHALVRNCLERAVAHYPNYASAWAMLSLVTLDEDRFAFNPRSGGTGPIEQALRLARRAVDLDSDNTRALQALMMALFFRQDVPEAVRVGEKALTLNPNDSELLSEFGTRVAMAGEWQRGRELVERALDRNPGYSGYYHAALALITHMQGDDDRALIEIRQANLEKFSIYHAIAAVIYAEHGLATEGRHEANELMRLHPAFIANLDAELRKRNLRAEDRARLADGLRKAGVAISGGTAATASSPKLAGSS